MITFEPAPDHVLAITLSGQVTRDDIKAVEDRLEALMAAHDRLGVIVDLTAMTDLTAGALAEDLRAELRLLPKLGRFPKIAVVSGKDWIGHMLRLLNPLLPVNEMKLFEPGQQEEAMAFATELGPRRQRPTGEIVELQTGRETLLAYEIRGHLTVEAMQALAPKLTEAFRRPGKVDLLLKIADYEGFSPEILLQRSTFSMKLAAFGNIRRYAIVGAKPWMEGIVHLFAPVTPMDIRTFGAEDEAAAWNWVNE